MNWWPKVDFSDESFAAVDTALELVNNPNHVCVLHVFQELHPYETAKRYGTDPKENREREIHQALRERLSDPNTRRCAPKLSSMTHRMVSLISLKKPKPI